MELIKRPISSNIYMYLADVFYLNLKVRTCSKVVYFNLVSGNPTLTLKVNLEQAYYIAWG